MNPSDLKKFDKRTRNRQIDKGVLTQKECDAFTKSLPDEANNYEEVPYEEAEETPTAGADPANPE